jgi:hypothetical protein
MWGAEVSPLAFITLALSRSVWTASRPGHFIPVEGIPGSWTGSNASNFTFCRESNSNSLYIKFASHYYRLSYPGSLILNFYHCIQRPRWRSRYSKSLRAARSDDRIPVVNFQYRPDRPWGTPSPLRATMGIAILPGSRRLGRGAKHTTPSSAEAAKGWSYTSTTPTFLNNMTWDHLLLLHPMSKPLLLIFWF